MESSKFATLKQGLRELRILNRETHANSFYHSGPADFHDWTCRRQFFELFDISRKDPPEFFEGEVLLSGMQA